MRILVALRPHIFAHVLAGTHLALLLFLFLLPRRGTATPWGILLLVIVIVIIVVLVRVEVGLLERFVLTSLPHILVEIFCLQQFIAILC